MRQKPLNAYWTQRWVKFQFPTQPRRCCCIFFAHLFWSRLHSVCSSLRILVFPSPFGVRHGILEWSMTYLNAKGISWNECVIDIRSEWGYGVLEMELKSIHQIASENCIGDQFSSVSNFPYKEGAELCKTMAKMRSWVAHQRIRGIPSTPLM